MSLGKINNAILSSHIRFSNLSDNTNSINYRVKSINSVTNENSYGDKYIKYTGNPKEDEIRIKASPHLKKNAPALGTEDSFKSVFENKSKEISRKTIKLNIKSAEVEEAEFVEVNDEGDVVGKGHYFSPGSGAFNSFTNKEVGRYIFEKYTNEAALRRGSLVNVVA